LVIKLSAIFLMTVLVASFSSFSSPFSNFDNEISAKLNPQNNILNLAFADSEKQNEKQAEKEERLAEKQKEKEERMAEKQKEKEERLAEKQAEKEQRLAEKEERLAENNDIQEFDEDVVITSSSTTLSAKTTICHIPPGNPGKAHTITVGRPAVPAHLAHGDTLGSCDGESPSVTDMASRLAEKQARQDEKRAEKEDKALQRAENLIEKLEQRIANLEQRLQKLLEKVESGEYFGNLPSVDAVTKTYGISFDGTATSMFDESVTADLSGEIFIENLITTSDVSKFKVTGGEIIVGDNIYDVVFGKARVSTDISDEKDSMVLILQTLDTEGNENTVKLTINFDSALEGDFGEGPIEFEIAENSKISEQWFLSATGQLTLSS
jgi:multidrug efflux pump subunit AcrA (membrane-fusion protein)